MLAIGAEFNVFDAYGGSAIGNARDNGHITTAALVHAYWNRRCQRVTLQRAGKLSLPIQVPAISTLHCCNRLQKACAPWAEERLRLSVATAVSALARGLAHRHVLLPATAQELIVKLLMYFPLWPTISSVKLPVI